MVIKEFNIQMLKSPTNPRTLQATFNDLLSNIQKPLGIHHIRTILFSLPVNYLKDLRDFGLDKGGVDPFSLLSTDYLVLYVTWRPFVFSIQFDLNLFMITTEDSSIFRLLTKESMLLTSATFLIEKRLYKKFHHISKINLFPLSPIATLTALAVKFPTTKKHCKILT